MTKNDITIKTYLPYDEVILRLKSVTFEDIDITEIVSPGQIKFRGNIDEKGFNLRYTNGVRNCSNQIKIEIKRGEPVTIIGNVKKINSKWIFLVILIFSFVFSINYKISILSFDIKEFIFGFISIFLIFGLHFLRCPKQVSKKIHKELNYILSDEFILKEKYL